MKFRFKNIFGFVLLSFFFLVPLLFRAIDRNFEIFPSITLPSNANKVFLNRNTSIVEQELYGLGPKGNQKKVDHKTFFQNIPIHFSHWIIRNNFGLDKNKVFNTTTPRLSISYSQSQKVTADEVNKTKEWMRHQLRSQGLNDSILIIRKNQIFTKHGRPDPVEKISTNDTIFALH
ncbi:hypothetical protein [Maribacter sp.]